MLVRDSKIMKEIIAKYKIFVERLWHWGWRPKRLFNQVKLFLHTTYEKFDPPYRDLSAPRILWSKTVSVAVTFLESCCLEKVPEDKNTLLIFDSQWSYPPKSFIYISLSFTGPFLFVYWLSKDIKQFKIWLLMKEKTKTKSTAREQAFYTPHLSTLKPVFLESQNCTSQKIAT